MSDLQDQVPAQTHVVAQQLEDERLARLHGWRYLDNVFKHHPLKKREKTLLTIHVRQPLYANGLFAPEHLTKMLRALVPKKLREKTGRMCSGYVLNPQQTCADLYLLLKIAPFLAQRDCNSFFNEITPLKRYKLKRGIVNNANINDMVQQLVITVDRDWLGTDLELLLIKESGEASDLNADLLDLKPNALLKAISKEAKTTTEVVREEAKQLKAAKDYFKAKMPFNKRASIPNVNDSAAWVDIFNEESENSVLAQTHVSARPPNDQINPDLVVAQKHVSVQFPDPELLPETDSQPAPLPVPTTTDSAVKTDEPQLFIAGKTCVNIDRDRVISALVHYYDFMYPILFDDQNHPTDGTAQKRVVVRDPLQPQQLPEAIDHDNAKSPDPSPPVSKTRSLLRLNDHQPRVSTVQSLQSQQKGCKKANPKTPTSKPQPQEFRPDPYYHGPAELKRRAALKDDTPLSDDSRHDKDSEYKESVLRKRNK